MSGLVENGFVALGANMPTDRATRIAALDAAIRSIDRDLALPGTLRASAYFHTPAYPAGIGADFVNACVAFRTVLDAPSLLAALHRIEAAAGRIRTTRWGPRPLDLDLLALGGQILPDVITQARWRELPPQAQALDVPDRLVLPHPRLQDRGFVLVPLAEIAPDWVHPVTGHDVTQMRDALPVDALDQVRRIDRL